MKPLILSHLRHAGWLAALLCLLAVLGFAALLEGYSHSQHPPAVLGASAVPHATAFNVLAFVVPGLLVAALSSRLRGQLPVAAGIAARVGVQTIVLSALAFAAQGVLPLDLQDMDGPVSGRHAAAWMLWWIAFAAGGLLLAFGLRRHPGWKPVARAVTVAAIAVPLLALVLPYLLPAGIAQRAAFAAWFAWATCAGYVSRSALSASVS